MRHGSSNNRRHRGRSNGPRRSGGSQKTQVFDSNGPDVRIRGTAFQVCEKYLALAKDSQSSGDLILWQSYLQHAEHYQRLINTWAEEEGFTDETDEDHDETPRNLYVERQPHQRNPQHQGGGQHNQNQRRDSRLHSAPSKPVREDDLGLPTSILGGFSKSDGQVQSEMESSS